MYTHTLPQDPLFNCVQQGDLKGLIELLARYPSGVNALDEVCLNE